MIIKGTFKSVSMAYGNHREQVIQYFLSRGWAVQSETKGNYNMGDIHDYITFVAGEYATEVISGWSEGEFNFPNAHLI